MKTGENSRRVGLARALSKLGYCSRSQAAELIRAGRVKLNGTTRRDPETPVHVHSDHIEVDSLGVTAETKVYLMLNKPRGVVTSAADEKGRQTVYSFLSASLPWVAPVGRLDKASEGLLLLTNDSQWAARIANPKTHLEKTYHVQAGALVEETFPAKLTKGIKTANGEVLCAKRASILRAGQRNTWLEIILDEGKNRHIRRMFEASSMEVLRLVRIAIGPLLLGELTKGECRALTSDEKRALDRAMGTSSS